MSELKPCPFCGNDDWYFEQGTEGEIEIVCDRCEYRSQTFQTIEDAIKWWETRPIEDELNKRITELEEKRRWIPVSERMPEVGKLVHVIDMNDIGSHLCNLYETAMLVEVNGNKRFGFIGHSGWDTSDVTHWMYVIPLPTPPEVQE